MRISGILGVGAVTIGLLATQAAPARAGGPPVPCSGTGSFGPNSTPVVRTVGGETFVTFSFDGTHPYCSAPGGSVDEYGSLSGTMSEQVTAAGQFDLQFNETMTVPDGSDQWIGNATGTVLGSGLLAVQTSEVRTVGTGTGQLAGVRGEGSFQITGFGGYGFIFSDVISYVYPA
jgi:hypothetical protein